ncbi:MAG: hypothetical protein IKS85_04105 [Lachnospiraceae bacterium]|nr:hypothetical protein [Lachnospiraceae bacterium]
MASSIIHLAITEKVTEGLKIKDLNRLRLGSVLPDGAVHVNGHMKIRICDGTRSTYDLEAFRRIFGERMKEDDLYLGYYLHLVQDLIFRRFVYTVYNWDPLPPGNVERLYRDYTITNAYVIQKYGLEKTMLQPISLSGEPILELGPFDVEELVGRIQNQFQPVEDTGIFFFTRKMADEFIEMAVAPCLEELKALADGKPGLGSAEWSWVRHS